ncbi:MAG: hypothetical protein CR975_03420 [Gammaproteobacteria bacterium]|nr:MAG: hypothetical protein CR975_03420 [Gammaproteobacteria bacterium]
MKKINYVIGFILLCLIHIAIAAPQTVTLQKGDKTVTVFGTIHVTKTEWLPLEKNIIDQLAQADALAVEMDVTDSKTVNETAQYMFTQGLAKKNLSGVLSAAEVNKMQKILGPMASGMMQMRPFLVALAVSLQRTKEMGFTDKSVDVFLLEQAKARHKPVLALETVAEQFSVFQQLSEAEELEFLRSALNEEEQFNQEIQRTVKVWQNNDRQAAQYLLDEFKEKMPNLYQAMFNQRNQLMSRRIQKMNKQYPHLMMAVGALHLYGDDSVIQQLKNSGYRLVKD